MLPDSLRGHGGLKKFQRFGSEKCFDASRLRDRSEIFFVTDGKAHVIGVVSRGDDCAGFNQPGIYTEVSKFLDWIEQHTKDATCSTRNSKTGNSY